MTMVTTMIVVVTTAVSVLYGSSMLVYLLLWLFLRLSLRLPEVIKTLGTWLIAAAALVLLVQVDLLLLCLLRV